VAVKNLLEASANFKNTHQYKFQLVAKEGLIYSFVLLVIALEMAEVESPSRRACEESLDPS
jgi:hypothetical protein